MEIFGDFECPACRAFFEQTVKQVIDDYVVPGKVYLVHHDFPLDMHPYARQAARLAKMPLRNSAISEAAWSCALYDKQDSEWTAKGNIDEVMATSISPRADEEIHRLQEAAHINLKSSTLRSNATAHWGFRENVNQTPTVYVTAHGKTEALPGGGVDYKLLKNYFDYLLRQ